MYEPELGHIAYHQYLDQLEYAEQVGFDGIGVNEHHANAYGLMPSPNIMAATLTRRTSKAALVVLGNSIALYNPPMRVAEEFAMLDVLSGGRLIAGFPVGTSMDTNYAYGTIPALTREKYAEAHDLIRKAWAADEPFAFNGRYTKLRYVNCWPKPIQKPEPPIFIPGGGSVETYDFCIDNTYSYSYLSYSGYLRAKLLMEGYWKRVAERKVDESPYRAGFAQVICVADTDAEAERLYGPHVNYFYNRCLHVYPGFADAPGYRTIKTIQTGALSQFTQAAARDYPNMTWKDLIDGRYVVAGSPETVRQQMEELIKTLRVGNIFCLMHVGNMPNDKVRHSTQPVRREGDAAPAQPVARLEQPRRPLLDASDERAASPLTGWLPNEGARFLHAREPSERAHRRVVDAPSVDEGGRDLLFLHGAGGHMPDDPLIAALATKYRVVAPLLPGYGQSTGEDGLRDMLDVTLHALDVLEALKLKKPIVVGHSMGGMIAAEMAAIAHTEVARLCLLAPAGLWLDDHPIADIFSKLPYELPGLLFHDAEAGAEAADLGRQHGGPRIPEAVPGHERAAAGHGGQAPVPHPRPRPGAAPAPYHRQDVDRVGHGGRADPAGLWRCLQKGDFEIEAGQDRQGRACGGAGEARCGAQGDQGSFF